MDENIPLVQTRRPTKLNEHGQYFLLNIKNSQFSGLYGSTAMLLAAIFFSTGGLFLRTAESIYKLPPNISMFLMFGSATVVTIISAFMFRIQSKIFSLNKYQSLFIAARSLFGAAGAYCYIKACSLINIGDVSVAFNICPVMTLMLAAIFLREKIKFVDVFSIIISAIGVFLITRTPNGGDLDTRKLYSYSQQLFGALFAAGSGTCAAIAYVSIRNLKESIHFFTPSFFFFPSVTILSILLGGIPTFKEVETYGYLPVFYVATAGFLNVLAQTLLNIGLQLCPAGPAIFFRTLEIPLQYFLGYLFLSENMSLNRVFAAFLIILSTVLIGIRNTKR